MAMNSSGDMSAMAPWLDRKYANMEQQTANQGMESAATAELKSAQASMTPLDVVSQAGLRGAQANYANQQAAMHPLEVKSMAGLRGQQASEIGYRNRFSGFLDKYGLTPAEADASRDPTAVKNMLFGIGGRAGFNKGTAKVMKQGETRVTDETGNGHPRVDTVPAMLAEGEAVLNAGAAERMGRDEIRQLNKQGLRDMKMDSGERPVLKKGGRIGPFTGLAMGTNFARTSPKNDAEYHPTEFSEPRDPEHDAEHMAQPLSSGGMGMGLRCGSAKVMKYADGTSDAGTGGHGSPDSPSAVNMAGTMGGRGRTMGAKFVGGRGYADGIDHVPAESESELDNFQRQRDRNQIDEAVPAGTPVDFEAVGQQGAVTPSRDTARLRQAYDLTAQGFANGTADVQALQPAQDPDMVYAADGTENIFSRAFGAAKDLGGRAAEGLRGLAQAAPVDLGTVGTTAAPTSGVPSSAAADAIAARQAAAQQAARAAMGESPAMAAQTIRGMAAPAMESAMTSAAPAMEQAAARAPLWQRPGQALARGLVEAAPAVGKFASKAAGPAAFIAAPAYQIASETNTGFYGDPNVPTADKATQAAVTGLRALGTTAGTVLGAGAGSLAGPLGTVAGGAGGAAAGQWLTDKLAPEKTDALRKWEADRAVAAGQAINPHQKREPLTPGVRAEQQAAAPKLTLRGLATMGTMMGHTGAATVLRDLTDRETNAVTAAAKANKLSEVQIFDPATLDAKTGDVKPGVERKDLSEQFNSQYLPMYAQQRQQANPGEKLTPAQLQAEAQLSFNLNRAAQEYGLKSGKGFDFKRPLLPNKTEYISDLPAITRIIGRARGENEWTEGVWDKGGIVVTDGLEKQVLPIKFLDEKWLNSPDMSLKVKSLIRENSAK